MDPLQQQHQHQHQHQHQQHNSNSNKVTSPIPPPPPPTKRIGSTKAPAIPPAIATSTQTNGANATRKGNGAYFVFPRDRVNNEPPVVSPWQHHINDKTPVQYLNASPNGNRGGSLRPMMIPSESRTDSLATISVSIPTGHSSLSSTQRQLQPIMYQAPGQQHMAQMMQIMSVSQPPSLSSFLASNRSIRSGDNIPSHQNRMGNLATQLPQALNELTQIQHHNALQNQHHSTQQQPHSSNGNPPPQQLHQHLSPAHSGHNLGSPLSTQFDSNELKAHQHIRLPPSHSSLTTLKPPESILSGLTSITSASRSRTRTLDRHAGSPFTALSQSDHSDQSDHTDDDGKDENQNKREEAHKLMTNHQAILKSKSSSKKSVGSKKSFNFGNYNGYHNTATSPYSNHPMSVFNAFNKMMESQSPRRGTAGTLGTVGSACVSPALTNDSWSKSHFSGPGIVLAQPRTGKI